MFHDPHQAVGESVSMPVWYYHNNLASTLVLLRAMKKHGCCSIIFSSSATVYGLPKSVGQKQNTRVNGRLILECGRSANHVSYAICSLCRLVSSGSDHGGL